MLELRCWAWKKLSAKGCLFDDWISYQHFMFRRTFRALYCSSYNSVLKNDFNSLFNWKIHSNLLAFRVRRLFERFVFVNIFFLIARVEVLGLKKIKCKRLFVRRLNFLSKFCFAGLSGLFNVLHITHFLKTTLTLFLIEKFTLIF